MDNALKSAVEAVLGRSIHSFCALSGGCVARVYHVRTDEGPGVVVKAAAPGGPSTFAAEAFMLDELRQRTSLPVPTVLHAGEAILVLEYMPGSSSFDPGAEQHAADLLAELHSHTSGAFGFERDTVIGPLPQRNPWTASWREFFAEHRLRAMADEAAAHGAIATGLRDRARRAADACRRLLREPAAPALLHGDVWSGNVLAEPGRVTAFLDPAISYGHPEVELAFITLLGTFGNAFFERYAARRPIEAGFFETRAAMYRLYPLLVHARLFGGAYPGLINRSLAKLGF